MNLKRTTPRYIIIKIPKVKDKEIILKAAREKQLVTYKGAPTDCQLTSLLISSFFKIVVQLQLSLFSTYHSPLSHPSYLQHSILSPPHSPLALTMGPLYMFLNHPSPSFSCYPLPPWLMSVCSLFQCLWLYFACLFVLLIKFYL